MMKAATVTGRPTERIASTGCEPELWTIADALRASINASEYQHLVLGPIFLKYISHALDGRRAAVLAEWGNEAATGGNGHTGQGILWVPHASRRANLTAQARQPAIGQRPDRAVAAIKEDKASWTEGRAEDDARLALDKQPLGQLIETVGAVCVGDAESRSKDLFGWGYGYFRSEFTSAERKRGGECS